MRSVSFATKSLHGVKNTCINTSTIRSKMKQMEVRLFCLFFLEICVWYCICVHILEFAMSNIEQEIHQEMVCVDPLRAIKMVIEGDNGFIELEESKLDYAATIGQAFSDGNEYDDDSETNDGFFDGDELPENHNGSQRPRHISEVSREQQQQIISFDMSCDCCKTTFQTFQDAIRHYKMKHKNQARGYVKCCSMKLSQNSHFNSHIVYHLNPDVYKWVNTYRIWKKKLSFDNEKTNISLSMRDSWGYTLKLISLGLRHLTAWA